LTSVSLPGGGVVSFQYDPFGRRIQKVSASGTSVYVYDGDKQIEELNASGGVVARYTQGLGIDEPLALYRSGKKYYYHADGLGSIAALTDNHGTPKASYTYDAFGNDAPPSPPPPPSSVTNPFRYTGRELDSETDLYYYRARYYDPSTGRFLSEDPVRLGDGGPSLYRYVRNNPVNLVDPSGAQEATAAGAAVGCVAGPAGCAVGAAIGAVVDVITDVAIIAGGAYLVMSAADAYDSARDYAKDKADRSRPKCSHCLPCEPPVGTIGYRADTDPGSAPHRGVPPPHWKLYVMVQNPNNCRCWWHPIPDNRGGFGKGTPPPFAVPIGPGGGGGFAP
jgi:RHS repeat-associated protein